MKKLYFSTYTYKPGLDSDDFRKLVKTWGEYGLNKGVLGHWERLDGKGGFMVMEQPADADSETSFERTVAYSEFLDIELLPVTTFEEALPTILKLYG